MPNRHGRYLRPYLEIEYDEDALTQENACCRYVPVVVRLCNVPEGVRQSVLFERVRKRDQNGSPLDDYEIHPYEPWKMRAHKDFPGYHEYQLQLLARPHHEETGSIHIKIESQHGTLLSEVIYRFDSRQRTPVCTASHDGSFRGCRFVPFVRTAESRDALQGQYPTCMPQAGSSAPEPLVPPIIQATTDPSSLRNWWLVKH